MSMQEAYTDQPSSHNTLNGLASRPLPSPFPVHPTTPGAASSDGTEALSSSEDGTKKSLIIDMKDLVGDAVGNVCYTLHPSLSPSLTQN
jgi:hypothetical protein